MDPMPTVYTTDDGVVFAEWRSSSGGMAWRGYDPAEADDDLEAFVRDVAEVIVAIATTGKLPHE